MLSFMLFIIPNFNPFMKDGGISLGGKSAIMAGKTGAIWGVPYTAKLEKEFPEITPGQQMQHYR